MYRVADYVDAIDRFAPFSTAMSWDNAGLLMGSREAAVERALVALDLTGPVLEEAVELGAALVVTHHPVIFSPLKRLPADSIPYRAAAAGLSVLCAHTNLDLAEGGVNDRLAARLGLTDTGPLEAAGGTPYRKVVAFVPDASADAVYEAMAAAGAGQLGDYARCGFLSRGEGRFLPLEGAEPTVGQVGDTASVPEVRLEMLCHPARVEAVVAAMKAAHPYEEPAYDVVETLGATAALSLGRVGELAAPMSARELAELVRERLGVSGVRYVAGHSPIRRVAVCGGSGGDLLEAARNRGAQALVTGEAKHHELLEAGRLGMTLIDGSHWGTERVVVEPLADYLRAQLPGAVVTVSAACGDGLRFLASQS